MQLKPPKTRNMASLKDEEQAATTSSNNNNNNTNNINNNHSNSNSNSQNEDELKVKRESLEARKQALEQRLSEKSWLLQQMQKQESAIINGNYEQMTINEFFSQLAQQYKHEQQLQALTKESSSILRRKQSTTSRESRESQQTSSNSINNINNNRQSETMSNRSSEYDNYQPAGGVGDMLVIGVAQQQAQQQHPMVKSALKKRPTPTPSQMQYMRQQQSHHLMMPYQRSQPDVISMYSANSSNVATLRQPPQVSPQQQPIIVQCDKYYLSPTHQIYNDCGFIKSSQNIKKYVSPLASPGNHSYEQQAQHAQHKHPQHRQLDAISLAPSYASVDMDAQQQQQQQQQQYRWRSQSHIAPLTPPQLGIIEVKSHSSDMLAAPLPSRYPPHDEISLSSSSTTIEKKAKSKQWLESSLDGPAVIRQLDSQPHSPAGSSSNGSCSQAAAATKPRAKLSSQSMSVSGAGVGRHYSMSNQRPVQNYPSASYAVTTSSKALLSQSTSYLNAMEQTMGISVSYPLEPLEIPPFRQLPPKPNQMQPTPPPRPPPVQQSHNNGGGTGSASGIGSAIQTALVSPPLAVATASLSPDIRIESPKNMTVVQQATFQPYKEVTKPFEMSDFYKYSTKFKQKEVGRPE
ncbi:putative mediator of RNA polymerase II transcription subunit 26 [Drosophila persimilis]|uniref:putative mediator of RNA polymerase II transcription subunit 26 n=1 Tax=Drosophila persimilis TaxID=7234 RepID=UPI000F083D73|nr:putative mediator of RNA polymerase II transcription subunit 26 [Drosophila persimilis]